MLSYISFRSAKITVKKIFLSYQRTKEHNLFNAFRCQGLASVNNIAKKATHRSLEDAINQCFFDSDLKVGVISFSPIKIDIA